MEGRREGRKEGRKEGLRMSEALCKVAQDSQFWMFSPPTAVQLKL